MTTLLRPCLSSYLIFGLLPFNSVFSMICSPGFTQVCPLDDIACPDDTEMICPHGAESHFMESLDRNGESGCQCIPDFLISHVKEKAESRAGKNVAPDIFKKIKIRIRERKCKCNLKIIPTGNQIDSKSTVKCDKKCSGTIEGLTLEAKSGYLYNATIQMTRGKGTVSGTSNLGPSSVPSGPACTCVEKKESQGGSVTVENEVTISENGETFVQTDSYNPITREAKIMVPAHGDFEKTTYIMLGMSSDSRIAGKMIVSSRKSCSIEDIPAFINLEDMMVDGSHKMIDTRRQVKVKQYQVRANTRKATEEEYNDLTDSMKDECEGKSILVSTTEIIDENQFLRRSMANFSSILQRSNGVNRNGCRNVYYGCSVSSPYHCIHWTYQGLGTIGQPSQQPLITQHIYGGVEQYCTRCCQEDNTVVFPCSCIQDEQTFSTAFAIIRERDGWGFDCLKRSNFCRWTAGTQLGNCRYTVNGFCNQAPECPWNPCPNQDCTTPSTSTTSTTDTTTV